MTALGGLPWLLLAAVLALPTHAAPAHDGRPTPLLAQAGTTPERADKGGYVLDGHPPPAPTPPSAAALDTLRQINAYRAAGAHCGSRGSFEPVAALQWNGALERAAAVQVRDMAARGVVAHDGTDGSGVGDRITRQGYDWMSAGENAAAGNATVAATLAQWMKSPGHCANLMAAGMRDVAVAAQHQPGSRYEWFWIMVLAAPASGR